VVSCLHISYLNLYIFLIFHACCISSPSIILGLIFIKSTNYDTPHYVVFTSILYCLSFVFMCSLGIFFFIYLWFINDAFSSLDYIVLSYAIVAPLIRVHPLESKFHTHTKQQIVSFVIVTYYKAKAKQSCYMPCRCKGGEEV
jgi:hypothetical protein